MFTHHLFLNKDLSRMEIVFINQFFQLKYSINEAVPLPWLHIWIALEREDFKQTFAISTKSLNYVVMVISIVSKRDLSFSYYYNEQKSFEFINHKVSISPTFYELLFCIKVFWTVYLCLEFGFRNFLAKEYRHKSCS